MNQITNYWSPNWRKMEKLENVTIFHCGSVLFREEEEEEEKDVDVGGVATLIIKEIAGVTSRIAFRNINSSSVLMSCGMLRDSLCPAPWQRCRISEKKFGKIPTEIPFELIEIEKKMALNCNSVAEISNSKIWDSVAKLNRFQLFELFKICLKMGDISTALPNFLKICQN